MRRNSTYHYSWIVILALAIFMNFAFAQTLKSSGTDSSYMRFLKSKNNKAIFKTNLHLVMPPIRPAVISTAKVSVAKSDDKLLSNVQVFPNPVTDLVNLKYDLSRGANVNIKILDVLGNDIITLYSQHLEAGEKNYSYSVNGKLTRGFYFVRIVAGTESVIKRISVL